IPGADGSQRASLAKRSSTHLQGGGPGGGSVPCLNSLSIRKTILTSISSLFPVHSCGNRGKVKKISPRRLAVRGGLHVSPYPPDTLYHKKRFGKKKPTGKRGGRIETVSPILALPSPGLGGWIGSSSPSQGVEWHGQKEFRNQGQKAKTGSGIPQSRTSCG